LAGSTAAAQPKPDPKADVLVSINQFVNAFNKGDMKTAVATCASPAVVIDEFPPHAWQGANACADWARDFAANAKTSGITEPVVKILKVNSNTVTGDRAYVVTTSSYDWKEKGKPMKESASKFTFALQKTPAGWRITGWAWTME
jgi:ketosteroid isomerase-like protein